MSLNRMFCAIKSSRICQEIKSSKERIIYASPGIQCTVAETLIEMYRCLGSDRITVVLDCNEDACRLGYGDIKAIRMLETAGIQVRQSPGLRFGLLICDGKGWSYSPVALYVADETFSDETPNAAKLMPEQIDAFVEAICPQKIDDETEAEIEIGVKQLTEDELSNVAKNLEIAPPIKFDIARQVRVFEPYIEYVEINLRGCSIQRKRIPIPKSIQGFGEATEIEARLRTTFELIEKNSKISSEGLDSELKKIRDDFTRSLGKQWGRVILKATKKLFDKRIEQFEEKLAKHKKEIEAELAEHLKKSNNQIVEYYLPFIKKNPPDALLGQVFSQQLSEDDIRAWLTSEIDLKFPKPKELTLGMQLDVQYRGVTYETLHESDFITRLREEYPQVPWDKPCDEFNAAKEKTKNE